MGLLARFIISERTIMPNCVIGFLARHRRVISSGVARPPGGGAAESRDLVVKMRAKAIFP